MVIYSDPPREKKQPVQVSDYEQAVERLKKVKGEDAFVNWHLATEYVDGGAGISYQAWVEHVPFGGLARRFYGRGSSFIDAACAAIDQFRTAMVAGEEKPNVVAGVDLASGESKAIFTYDVMTAAEKRSGMQFRTEYLCEPSPASGCRADNPKREEAEEWRVASNYRPPQSGVLCHTCKMLVLRSEPAYVLVHDINSISEQYCIVCRSCKEKLVPEKPFSITKAAAESKEYKVIDRSVGSDAMAKSIAAGEGKKEQSYTFAAGTLKAGPEIRACDAAPERSIAWNPKPEHTCAGCESPIINLNEALRVFHSGSGFADVCGACFKTPGPRVKRLLEIAESIQAGI